MRYAPPLPLERLLAGLIAISDHRRRSTPDFPLDADPNTVLANLPPQCEAAHTETARELLKGLRARGFIIEEEHHGRPTRDHAARPAA